MRGVDPIIILKILRSKGFQPHLNQNILHKIMAWQLFDEFLVVFPDFLKGFLEDPDVPDRWTGVPGENTAVTLPNSFTFWVEGAAGRGLSGAVIAQMLEDRGLSVEKNYPAFSQKLINGEFNYEKCSLSFHVSCEKGYAEFVKVYCESGVDVDEESISIATNEPLRALAMAALHGHDSVVQLLLLYGADVLKVDGKGRSALHCAASKGYTHICRSLLQHKAELFAPDFHGNNALHLSVYFNHFHTLSYLGIKGLEYYRAITADATPLGEGGQSFQVLVSETFLELQEKLLSPSEPRRFEKVWFDKATALFLRKINPSLRRMLALPNSTMQIFSDVLARSDPNPDTGVWHVRKSDRTDQRAVRTYVPSVEGPEHLSVLIKCVLRQVRMLSSTLFLIFLFSLIHGDSLSLMILSNPNLLLNLRVPNSVLHLISNRLCSSHRTTCSVLVCT